MFIGLDHLCAYQPLPIYRYALYLFFYLGLWERSYDSTTRCACWPSTLWDMGVCAHPHTHMLIFGYI